EVMLTAMAPHFQARGVTSDVVALLQRTSPLEGMLLEQGVSLRYTGVRRLYSLSQVAALAKLISGYDIIHVHLFPAQLWTVLATVRSRSPIPLVTTEHSTWNARRQWWLWPLDLWMYRHYESISCISEAAAEELTRRYPAISKKISVI